jgi:hypothetical protein
MTVERVVSYRHSTIGLLSHFGRQIFNESTCGHEATHFGAARCHTHDSTVSVSQHHTRASATSSINHTTCSMPAHAARVAHVRGCHSLHASCRVKRTVSLSPSVLSQYLNMCSLSSKAVDLDQHKTPCTIRRGVHVSSALEVHASTTTSFCFARAHARGERL